MTLSREARIIIGIVFVAVAAWLWINYFTQAGEPVSDELPAPTAPAPAVVAPPVVAPPAVARELTIAQLPFLVTAAPEVAVEVVALAEEALIARPEGDQRAAINPFSPIIVRTAPEPATPAPAVAATTPPPIEVANIPLPSVPAPQPPPVVSAPVPRPLAPPPPVADNLPRALPSGTLPIAPSILRQARVAPPGPANLAEVVAIRVPEATVELSPGLTPDAPAAPAAIPLRPLAPTPAVALQVTPPLSAGANPLARYLRDQNVTLTGSVLGPIGVGVFRSNLTLAPVVVALGQPLPDTDIVLKGLRGQEAVFSQGNHSETLVLNLRR